MLPLQYSSAELFLFRCPSTPPPRSTRKKLFKFNLWNPDHPRAITTVVTTHHFRPTSTRSPFPPRQLRPIQISPVNNRTPTPCKIGSWNACSINNKSALVENHIVTADLDIFAVVETSHEATNSPSLIASSPSGYSFLDKARPLPPGQDFTNLRGPRGGGICIFYKDHLQTSPKDTGYFTTFEHLSSYFTFKDLHLLVVVIYRPGSASITTAFFEEFSSLLATLSKFNCYLLILGDMNIKFDQPDNLNTKHMVRLLTSHNLIQHILEPTHNLGHTLDVVISRLPSLIGNIDISPPGHSDHSIIHFTITTQPPPRIYQKIERRSFSNFDIFSFQKDLEETELYRMTLQPTPPVTAEYLFTLYDHTMEDLLNTHAPLRKITIRKKTDCPWFDSECATLKRKTRHIERKCKHSPKDTRLINLLKLQSQKQRKIFQHKRSVYLRQNIEEAEKDGKALWKSLNSILSPQSPTECPLTPDELLDNFVNKTAAIRHSTKDAPLPVLNSNHLNFPGLCAFDELSLPEVDKLLSDSSSKHCELDSSPVWIIKSLRHIFVPILLLLINCSLNTATLPTSHKRAIIRPRLKKSGLDPSDPSNYRPISNLSFISKLVERAVHCQLLNYVESNSLLPLAQSGFRRLHSTETAVLKVYNEIIMALDSGFITALLLLDFSSAFDCVDHSILLQVLESQFGIMASALLWIANFLTNRSHSVRLGSNTSRYFSILFGVPQGSILGPLLFILYTSNIVHIAFKHGIFIHLYADDTQLYIKLSTNDFDNAMFRLINCFTEIQSWCASMRLKLNASKTELIFFYRHLLPNSLDTVLNLGPDCSIKPADVVRDLGVLLDNSLSMKNQISSITKSCFFHLRRIRQVKKSLNEKCLRTLVQALVISRIDYCNSVLYGLPASTLQPLTTVLHCAAKLIKNLNARDHITPTLRELHWLPIQARINFKICLLMYRIYTHTSPSYLSSLVTLCSSIQSRRGLRSSSQGDFVVTRSLKKLGNRAFALAGPAEWNKLPDFIRKSSTLSIFKTNLKTYLFKIYYD